MRDMPRTGPVEGDPEVLVLRRAEDERRTRREHHVFEAAVVVEARRVQVVDTVGAGDTFNAGVLASLHDARALTKTRIAKLDEEMVVDALTLGVRAAAITVSRAGANPPRRDEL